MAVPKTSGFLNNCGVNGGLHIIIGIFKKLAKDSDTNEIPAPVKAQYQELLRLFAQRYEIDVSYSSLDKYLGSLENNTAQQIVMGPVLRDYMKKNGAPEDLTSIQDDGRYTMLTVKQVSDYAYAPLGISIEATEPGKNPETLSSPNEIAEVHYHLEDQHFQASTPGIFLEHVIEDHEKLHKNNPELSTAISLIGEEKSVTETVLEGICQAVQNRFFALNNLVAESNFVNTMASYKKLYQQYTSLGFFANNVEQEEPILDKEVKLDTAEEPVDYDEKLAIQLQKEEFDKVQDSRVFDDAEQIQSDEELARLLQEEEYSKFAM